MAESAVTVKVHGLDQTLRALTQLQTRAVDRVQLAGLRKGARILVKAARANLPAHYTDLISTIGARTQKKSGYWRTMLVGPGAGRASKRNKYNYAASIGIIVEYGTLASRREPLAKPRKQSWRVDESKRRRSFIANRRKPLAQGLAPIPFMRRAYVSTRQEVFRAINQGMLDEMRKSFLKGRR